MAAPQQASAQTSPHFPLLDGLRGVAALAVLMLHAGGLHGFPWLSHHAALAVDFFFCLSGFVLAHAYDARLRAGLGVGRFMALRLVRLYPMIAMGMVLGWISLAAFPTVLAVSPPPGVDPPHVAWYGVSGLLLVPLGLLFGNEVYPVDNPAWSLFFELVASLGFALGLARLSNRRLAALALLVLPLLAVAAWRMKGVEYIGFIGWKATAAGFPRVAFPFLCGVLVHRTGLHRRVPRLPAMVPAGLLALMLLQPLWQQNWLHDLLAICLMPLIVALAAASPSGAPDGVAARVGWRLGDLSYPLYLVHLPVIRGVLGAFGDSGLAPEALFALCVVASIGSALVLASFYDRPVRAALGRWLRRRLAAAGTRIDGTPQPA